MCRCKKNSRRISNLVLKLKMLLEQVLLALNKAKVFYLAGFSLSLGKEVSTSFSRPLSLSFFVGTNSAFSISLPSTGCWLLCRRSPKQDSGREPFSAVHLSEIHKRVAEGREVGGLQWYYLPYRANFLFRPTRLKENVWNFFEIFFLV